MKMAAPVLVLVLCLLPVPRPAWAAPGWQQRLGARLPLDEIFTDELGRASPLASYAGGGPLLLVFGYYRCPNLCDAVLPDLLVAAAGAGLPKERYRLLVISIDPGETPSVAAQKRKEYVARLGLDRLRFNLLTGKRGAIDRVASAAGFHYAVDPQRGLIHPAGSIVATADGTISRYFLGAHAGAQALRLALVEASDGRVGTLSDRIVLLCSHFDPATGRYTGAAMTLVRTGCALVLLALLAVAGFLHRRARRTA